MFESPFTSVSKRVFVRNHLYENGFCLPLHFHVNRTYFRKKGFSRRLVLKQRCKVTRKWPVDQLDNQNDLSNWLPFPKKHRIPSMLSTENLYTLFSAAAIIATAQWNYKQSSTILSFVFLYFHFIKKYSIQNQRAPQKMWSDQPPAQNLP